MIVGCCWSCAPTSTGPPPVGPVWSGPCMVAVWFGSARGSARTAGGASRHSARARSIADRMRRQLLQVRRSVRRFQQEQVWTHVNAYRRKFLAANHNAEEGIVFVPTNILAYFRPDGLRLTSVFPFITLPGGAAAGAGRRALRPEVPDGQPPGIDAAAVPPGLLGAGHGIPTSTGGEGRADPACSSWPRALPVPPSCCGVTSRRGISGTSCHSWCWPARWAWRTSGAGWRAGRESVRSGPSRSSVCGPLRHRGEHRHGDHAERGVEHHPGPPLRRGPEGRERYHGAPLIGHPGELAPPWGPADQLYVVGNCDGLYISNGEDYSTVPSQQFVRNTWMAVELGHAFQHTFESRSTVASEGTLESPLVTVGSNSCSAPSRPRPSQQCAGAAAVVRVRSPSSRPVTSSST